MPTNMFTYSYLLKTCWNEVQKDSRNFLLLGLYTKRKDIVDLWISFRRVVHLEN